MSHPFYNPYAPGKQGSTQGQYGLSSTKDERDPQMSSSSVGPGSSFSSSGASSVTPASSGGMLLPQSMSYRPEQSRSMIDEDIERSVDMHISRARERVKPLEKPMLQPTDHGTQFTRTQSNDFLPLDTGMGSYPMSSTSASQGHRHLGVESGSSSLDWSSNYKRPTGDDPSKFNSSSTSSNYASGGDRKFSASYEREHDKQSIPGLGDFDYPVPDKPAAPTESSRPKYSFESASNILLHFGLEKEDLDHLLAYPEEQMTPANLPFILREIRIAKTKRAATAAQSKPCPTPQPARNVSGMDSKSLSLSGGMRMHQKEMSSAVLQPSNVIDYGHTGKYSGGVWDEIGQSSGANSGGSMLLMDTCNSSRNNQEPLQKTTTEVKSSALGSSRDQTSSVSSPSSSYSSTLSSVAPPSRAQTKQMPTQSNQIFQSILKSFYQPKKDRDIRVLKSEDSKPVPLKKTEADFQTTSKIQPPSTLRQHVHPSRPGLVHASRVDASETRDESKILGQWSVVTEQMNKQQTQQQKIQQKQRTQMQAVLQMDQKMQLPVSSAVKSVPPASHIPSFTVTMQYPGGPFAVIPPAVPKTIPKLVKPVHPTVPPSKKQPRSKVAVSKGLPSAAMMHDYAAATPRIFPHTCCLCKKECTRMQEWLAHQNSNLHLESCKRLRKRYPKWNGEISLKPRTTAGKDAKTSHSTSLKTSRHRQKARHGTRSHSHSASPRRHHGSEGREEKCGSRSQSPYSSRYTRRRSRSHSHSPRYDRPTSSRYRSRSRSAERRSSPRQRDKKWSPQRRRDDRQSSPRRDDRWSSPRRDDRRSSPRRDDRQSSPRWSGERLSPPRWRDERLSPPRWRDERLSPPRRRDDRLSPPRRRDERLSPPRRRDERLSPPRWRDERLSPPRRRDESLSPPRWRDTGLSPPRWRDERLSPPRWKDERLSPPGWRDERLSPSRWRDERQSPPRWRDEKQSPPRMSDQRQSPKRKKSSIAESLVKKVLKTSGVQSLSEQSDLEAVAKTLVPAFLAELAKMNSSPSSSSTVSSSSTSKKRLSKKSSKAKSKKGSSHGKTKETVSKELMKPPPKQPAPSSVSTPQSMPARKVLLPTPFVPQFPVPPFPVPPCPVPPIPGPGMFPGPEMFPVPPIPGPGMFPGPEMFPFMHFGATTATTSKCFYQQSAAKGSFTGRRTVTYVKVSEATNVPTKQITKIAKGKLPANKAGIKAVAKQNLSSGSTSTAPGNSKPKVSETKVQEAVPKDAAKAVEEAKVTVDEPKHQAELDKTNDVKDAEPMEVGEMGAEVAEPMEREKPTTTEAVPESSDKSRESQPPNSTVDTQPTETSVEALPHLQQSTSSQPESTAPGLKTKTEDPHMQQQAAGSSTETAVEAKLPGGGVEATAMQEADESPSKPSDLEAVDQTLVPALVAEVAEMKSPSSPSSPSIGGKLSSSSAASSSQAEPSLQKSEEMVSKEPEEPPQNVSTPQTTTTTMVLPPTPKIPPPMGPETPSPLPSGAGEATTAKTTSQKSAAKVSVKGQMAITKAKVLVAKANVATKQIAKMVKTGTLPVKEAVRKALVEQIVSSGSKSTTPENSEPKESETKVQEAVPKDAAKAVEEANVTVDEPKHQAELDKTNDAKDAEPMEVGEMGAEVAEPVEAEKPTTTEAVPENSADISRESQPPNSTVDTRPTETSVEALPHLQQSTSSQTESTAPGLEIKTEDPHMQQQAAGSSTETAVEVKLPGGGVEATAMQEVPVTAVKTETDEASAKDTSECRTVDILTIGEMMEKHLDPSRIPCFKAKECQSAKFPEYRKKQVLITNLPAYNDGCYTVEDITKLLSHFGYIHTDDSLHVVPGARMAVLVMPTMASMLEITRLCNRNDIIMKGYALGFHVVANNIPMTPLEFYRSLMKLMNSPCDEGKSVVFIKNISWSETKELREALKKINSVTNFLPLLNKVFIEFPFQDADRLGVWYSLRKRAPGYEVHRLNLPFIGHTCCLPRLPENALPDSKDAVAGATIPRMELGIPQGSIGPSWVTMRTRPFLYSTVSPWFIIPDYLTIRGLDDIKKASGRGSMFSTIMLTGLPIGNCKHEDVAKLVWRYFPNQSLQSLYYNVTALMLQRRAFVFFDDWTLCCAFVRDHLARPVSVKGCQLGVHFVLEQMRHESSEEMMYTTMMKWSNAGVPDPESLEDRMLCVEISAVSPEVIRVVMDMVGSIATFVGFLPLANRICIEMTDSTGVTKVVEKSSSFSPDSAKKSKAWSKVQHIESAKSLNQRLQDSSEIPINFGPDTIYVKAQPPAVEWQTQPPVSELWYNGSQPALQTSGPGGSTISAGPNATTASDEKMEEDSEEPGTEIAMDSTVDPEANDVEEAEVQGEEGSLTTLSFTADVTSNSAISSGITVPAASSPTPSAAALTPEVFQVLKAAVRNLRLTRECMSQIEDNESPSTSGTTSRPATTADPPQGKCNDFAEDSISSDLALLFDGRTTTSQARRRRRRKKQISDAVTAVTTQKVEASVKNTSKRSRVDTLTVGEMIDKYLDPTQIECVKLENVYSTRKAIRVLITNLPEYRDGCYTEDELATLLAPFGFHYTDSNIYIVPQMRMAFVRLPKLTNMYDVLNARRGVFFKGFKLRFQRVAGNMSMITIEFYKSLMRLINWHVVNTDRSIVFINNITWSETKELRETLKKIGGVKNILPLVNKVYIEFACITDADRLGVWYSLLKQDPGHEVNRLNVPELNRPVLAPRLPENALPDSKDAVAGATIPPMDFGIPQGSVGPSWVTMRTRPFLFATVSPWYIIPYHLTVRGLEDIEMASGSAPMSSTVMLTGLPIGDYKHEDVAKLVWRYFPIQNLRTLYYNVTVLPLQRRAFVFFNDWTSCCDFARDHVANPVSVKGCTLTVHFVLEQMYPESSERKMYRTLMKWSNAGIPNPKSLRDRLLCVKISETSLDVIRVVMEMVASFATFVNFLPLANRICIEMDDAGGVATVLNESHTFSPKCIKYIRVWKKVQHAESMKNLKKRLHDSSKIKINLGPDTIHGKAKHPAVKYRPGRRSQPALQTSGPGRSTISAGLSAASNITTKEDSEKPEPVITMDYAVDPEANDVDEAAVKGQEWPLTTLSSTASVPAAYSPDSSATAVSPDLFQALKAAVRSYRLAQEGMSQIEDKEGRDDCTHAIASSDGCYFDEQAFNTDEFVTIDEVGIDVGDTSPEPHTSSSFHQSSGERRERSVSPKRSKVSSEPTKSPTDPLASASVSKASSSSSMLSTETSSEAKASSTVSPGCSTRSSSAAHEKEKITSATTVKASMKTLKTEPHQEESIESAVTKSDLKVSAEGISAETPESEIKTETSSEFHPALQGHGDQLSQAQSLVIDLNVNTLKVQKSCKEEPKEDDVDKHADENDEKYQILDSFDQTDEPMDVGGQDSSSDAQPSGPEGGRTLHEESFQVLDSIDDEDEVHAEEYNEVEMDGSFQVLDSDTEDQTPTDKEVCQLVLSDSSTESEEDETAAGDKFDEDSVGKDHETNVDNFQLLVKGCKQAPRDNGDESCNVPKDMEHPDRRIPKENHPPQDPNNEETLKDPDSDVTEQETFEILDSIDDQTATENDRASKIEKMEKSQKQDRVVKKYETWMKMDTTTGVSKKDEEVTEEMVYEVVDSVEGEPVQDAATTERSGRRTSRRRRGKKQDEMALDVTELSEKPEEATYEILDSVEDETVNDEPTVTTRSTRGKRKRTKTPPKESIPSTTGDNVTREVSEEDAQPATRGKRKVGRPKKAVKTTKKESTTLKEDDKDASLKESDEEEAIYQIVDSVDVTVDDQPPTGQSKEKNTKNKDQQTKKTASLAGSPKNEEEEPLYQVIDSLEVDQAQEEPTATEDETKDETPTKEVEKEDKPTCGTTVEEVSEKVIITEESVYQIVDDFEVNDDPSAVGLQESTPEEDIKKEDKSTTKSSSDTAKFEGKNKLKSPEKCTSILVSLDEVSEEEEEYPDGVAEEEELRKRQAAAKEKKLAKERELRRTREKEERRMREREQRSQSSGSSSSSRGGGGGGTGTRRAKERGREKEEMVEVDPKELVTLDEVGADEAGEERATENRDWDGEITEGDLQALVTLDEFIEEEEEEEEGKAEQSMLETRPPSQDDESVDLLNPETLVTLDEAGDHEEEKPHKEQTEKTSRSAKRKHNDDTEENVDFVTLDEVGEMEEEEAKEAVKTKTRGRPKKRTRQTPVRRSTRGKKVSANEGEEEREPTDADVLPPTPLDASSSLDKDPSSDDQPEIQKTEVEAAIQADIGGQELQPGPSENQTLEGCVEEKEGQSKTSIKVASKRRGRPVGPEAKRSRSQSPGIAGDVLCQESVASKSEYFCHLCSVFCPNENKDVHCSSQGHLENLKKQDQKPSISSQGSVSD